MGLFGGYGFGLAELASPLLGDAYGLAGLAVQWGVPAILVLAGLLMSATTGNGAVIGNHCGRRSPPVAEWIRERLAAWTVGLV
ncbi:hypothetical protein E1286_40650 [Nonomuraea terrae]|uniref:Uncharacterized protein n=1 Tax=Nonomuraea terrae TaxID=2530383 RepID=A0A4R4XU05_9ACTN|nr:hypothetical protein [Nonomuraea terrae]TDD34614.1 hypothetical protein E1286_40650 [Nonomuraea terrae]